MTRNLPPLSALRSFEAAARLQSFSRAADEISVTHGAVSHQVRSLERALGAALFLRNGRRVVLTTAGRHFAERVRAALQDLAEAAQFVRRSEHDRAVSVSMLPSFAARWLMPRLGRFMQRHPAIAVNIHTSNTLVDFQRDDVDLAIRIGSGRWPDLEAHKFMDEEYFPVASPRFNRGRLPAHPAELGKFQLMRSNDEPWTPWFRAAGVRLKEPHSVIFTDSNLLLQAAVDGRGIALARSSIAAADLRAGKLVRLFKLAVPAHGATYLVWPKDRLSANAILVRDWLLEERQREG
ncbi:MAG: transcriptional regulator GcvA [Betaproteobacteria bacterium]|nr:MAG: transcriptional regulator GcvA [Betaproteobacteria bacterium]